MLNALPNLIAKAKARIGAKLLFSLLSIVLLFIVLGWVAVKALQSSDDRTQALIDLQRRIAAYQALQSNTTELQAIVANAFLESGKSSLDAARRQIGQIAYDFDRAEFISAEDRDRIDSIRDDYTALVATGHAVLDQIEAGQLGAARDVQVGSVAALGDRIERLTFGLIAKAESQMLQKGADGRRAYLNSRHGLIGISVVSVLFAFLVGFAISRSLVRPLRRTSDRLAEIEAGDFSGTLVVANQDEIGELAQNVNRMSRELESLYQKLEEASQHKSEFLATMSHEIRTPMNAIMSVSELLLDTPLSREQRDYAQTSRDSGRALLTVIDDILDFSKIEAGELELEAAEFDLRACVEGALDMIAHVAAHKKIELAYRIEPGTPEAVIGDVVRLRQIFINLLNNAVKFTDEGEVAIEISADPDTSDKRRVFRFHVRDTGIGIPADRLDRLFQSFKQVDPSTKRKYGGTGLGLSICKRLINLMDGDIDVTSEEGVGTSFHFDIKMAAQAGVSASVVGGVALEHQRVLLMCDGTTTTCKELQRYVQAWGLETVFAPVADAARVLELAQSDFDGVIVDLDQVDYNSSALKAVLDSASTGVAIGLVRRGVSEEEFSGFGRLVRKPFKPSDLYNTLVDVLVHGDIQMSVAPTHRHSVFDGQLARRHPLRILVADDHATNRKLALQVLGRLGYDAKTADNGKVVLSELSQNTYDLVLMDIHMPEMDGLEATAEIRRQYPDGWPRVVMLTANVVQGDWENCREAGAADIVRKPIEIGRLVQALKQTHAARETYLRSQDATTGAKEDAAMGVSEQGYAHVDPDAIAQLVSLIGGRPEMFRELLESFRNESQLLFWNLQKGAASDAELLRVAAHTIKSSAADFGAVTLNAQCTELERLGDQKKLEEAQVLVRDALTEWTSVEAELLDIARNMASPKEAV